MKLDARKPLLVLTGAWNPAIFTPGWVALHILDRKENTNITYRVVESIPDGRQILYVADSEVGYYADNTRLELYLNRHDQESLLSVADFVSRLITTLPHTPTGDFGLNLVFAEQDVTPELADMLTSNDKIDHYFTVIASDFTSRINFSNDCQLNLKRVITAQGAIFEFNYHHSASQMSDLKKLTAEYIAGLCTESCETLGKLYGLVGDEQISHDFGS